MIVFRSGKNFAHLIYNHSLLLIPPLQFLVKYTNLFSTLKFLSVYPVGNFVSELTGCCMGTSGKEVDSSGPGMQSRSISGGALKHHQSNNRHNSYSHSNHTSPSSGAVSMHSSNSSQRSHHQLNEMGSSPPGALHSSTNSNTSTPNAPSTPTASSEATKSSRWCSSFILSLHLHKFDPLIFISINIQ